MSKRKLITAATLRTKAGEQIDEVLSGKLLVVSRHERPVIALLSWRVIQENPDLKAALERLFPEEG